MLLTDFFQQNGGNTVVANALESNPDFAAFNLMWQHPDDIIPACSRIGITTAEGVVDWVLRVNAAIGNPQAFVANVDPVLNIKAADLPVIAWPDIHKAVAEQCKLAENFFLDNTDRTYRLPTKAQWEHIASACPSKRMKHSKSDAHDCDDFVRHFQGWLASKQLGNLAHGFCGTLHYLNGTLQGGHAVVLVIDSDRKVWQLEPQTGKLHEPSYARLGGNIFANEVRLARLYF